MDVGDAGGLAAARAAIALRSSVAPARVGRTRAWTSVAGLVAARPGAGPDRGARTGPRRPRSARDAVLDSRRPARASRAWSIATPLGRDERDRQAVGDEHDARDAAARGRLAVGVLGGAPPAARAAHARGAVDLAALREAARRARARRRAGRGCAARAAGRRRSAGRGSATRTGPRRRRRGAW